MIIAKNIKTISEFLDSKAKNGLTIGFVPTMGALHQGHISLVKQAKKECKVVVVSIFVNPSQFGPNEDYKKYPRVIDQDCQLLKQNNVDAVFLPTADQMYPRGFSTWVNESKLSDHLCGQSRPGHFKGVGTVVVKLFNIIQPNKAYFGAKDYQQALIIKKIVKDLNIPVKIVVCPIKREFDGLAMSSRNVYLDQQQRQQALALFKSLKSAENKVKSGCCDPKAVIKTVSDFIKKHDQLKIDYIRIVDAQTLEPIEKIVKPAVLAVAVFAGKTRLIDNIVLIKS